MTGAWLSMARHPATAPPSYFRLSAQALVGRKVSANVFTIVVPGDYGAFMCSARFLRKRALPFRRSISRMFRADATRRSRMPARNLYFCRMKSATPSCCAFFVSIVSKTFIW
jgi:hypothetical protein